VFRLLLQATFCAVSDQFFFEHIHLCRISTSSGSSGDGFRIADPHFLWLSFQDMGMGHTGDDG